MGNGNLLVDALLAAGIEPFATLYHWDLPQKLQDEGGWTNRDITADFEAYADSVSRRIGDRVHKEYGEPEIYITGNGTPIGEEVRPDGTVADPQRADFLKRHLAAAWHAVQEGVKLRGFFVWSLMDNFELSFGFSKRFGLTRVDYATQKRSIKDSGRWYADAIRRNGVAVESPE